MKAWLRDVIFERFQAFVGGVFGLFVALAGLHAAPGAGLLVAAVFVVAVSASQAWAFSWAARASGQAGVRGALARAYRDGFFVAGAVAAAFLALALVESLWLRWGGASPRVAGLPLAALAGLLAAVLLGGHALWPRRVRVMPRTVGSHPPAEAASLRIAHWSDLHLGNGVGRSEVERWVARSNELAPDLVVLTGDLFDGPPEILRPGAEALAGLSAPLGVFAVLGNHDVELGADRVAAALRDHAPGIRLLRGEGQRLETHAGEIFVAGVEDPGRDWTRDGHLPVLEDLAARRPAEAASLLLLHRPDGFPQAARLGFDLVLAGHFHGGQIAVPGSVGRLSPAGLLTRYPCGVFNERESTLFVSRGIGFAGPRIRVGSPPEIALHTWCPAAKGAAS